MRVPGAPRINRIRKPPANSASVRCAGISPTDHFSGAGHLRSFDAARPFRMRSSYFGVAFCSFNRCYPARGARIRLRYSSGISDMVFASSVSYLTCSHSRKALAPGKEEKLGFRFMRKNQIGWLVRGEEAACPRSPILRQEPYRSAHGDIPDSGNRRSETGRHLGSALYNSRGGIGRNGSLGCSWPLGLNCSAL